MVRRAADEHLLAPHIMASEFEPQNMTPLPIPPTPAAPPRYIHIPTHPSRSPSLRTSLFSFIILQSSQTMLTPARLPLPPAPSTPCNARNEHTVTPPVGQRSPSHHPPPPTVHSYACCTHPPYTPRSPIQHPIPSISTDVGAAGNEATMCWPRFPVPTLAHPLAHTHPMLPSILFPLAFG